MLSHVFNNLVPGKQYTVSVIVVASSGSSSSAVERPLRTREFLIYETKDLTLLPRLHQRISF